MSSLRQTAILLPIIITIGVGVCGRRMVLRITGLQPARWDE
jgi:hypothetical protein